MRVRGKDFVLPNTLDSREIKIEVPTYRYSYHYLNNVL